MVRVALTSRAPKTDSGNTPTFGARPSISLIIESAIPLFKTGPKCPASLNGRLGLLWHIAAIHACDREIVAFGPKRRFAASQSYVQKSGVKPTCRHCSTDANDPKRSSALQ